MCHRIATLFIFCFTLAAQKVTATLDEADKEGILEIVFITALGDHVSGEPTVMVEKIVDGKPEVPWKGARTMKLKYGRYRLHVQYSGAYPVDKMVKIQDTSQTVFICFFIAPIESPWDGNLVRGRISEKSRQNDCRWVRFICPFADNEFAETKASDQGYFALENVRAGKYFAFTLGKKGICEMAEVTILFELGRAVHDLSIPWAMPPNGEARK